jgi:hypothetical protein
MIASQRGVDVDQCTQLRADHFATMVVYPLPESWLPVSIAPSDADLEVGVTEKGGVHALVFPVRKSGNDWVDASTKKRIDIEPTHWRRWKDHY